MFTSGGPLVPLGAGRICKLALELEDERGQRR